MKAPAPVCDSQRRWSAGLRFLITFLWASTATATSFVVPTDNEMVAKSHAIVIGTVEGSYVEWGDRDGDAPIQTVYEIRVQRPLKGTFRSGELVRIVSPGGELQEIGLSVPGAAHYIPGERAVIFLSRHKDHWDTTDLMLGKFAERVSPRGRRLLVRDDESDEGHHVETGGPRDFDGFIRFIENAVAGRSAGSDYVVDTRELSLQAAQDAVELQPGLDLYPSPAERYTQMSGYPTGVRWPPAQAAGGISFRRRTCTACDAITGTDPRTVTALAAWTNECGSNINLSLGPTTTASQGIDRINVIEFNDPRDQIGGSWTGSGTIAITFIGFQTSPTVDSGPNFRPLIDADIIFQNGYTAAEQSFTSAMTHEIGHGIGFRHSNASPASPNDSAQTCNNLTEECTSGDNSAVMYYRSFGAGVGASLQTWDVHAVQSVYPGGSCGPTCLAPVFTQQPASTTIAAGGSATLTASASGTGVTYQWYIGPAGNTSNPIAGATGSSLTVRPGSTTTYWVRATSSCGAATNSSAATVTVTVVGEAAGTASRLFIVPPCRLADTRNASGPLGGPVIYPGTVRTFIAAGNCGISATARSVVINLTAVSPASNGWLTAYPGTGSGPPSVSTLNYRTGRTRANNAIIRLSSDGKISVYNSGPSAIHAIVDVNGYFQ